MEQPQVITLNSQNSVQILLQFIETAHKSGAYLLAESDLLKRCKDFLLSGAVDAELTPSKAKTCLIQAINKGQSKGVYTLDEASTLFKVCQYVQSNLDETVQPVQAPAQAPQAAVPQPQAVHDDSADLSSLSDPVPLRKPRVV